MQKHCSNAQPKENKHNSKHGNNVGLQNLQNSSFGPQKAQYVLGK